VNTGCKAAHKQVIPNGFKICKIIGREPSISVCVVFNFTEAKSEVLKLLECNISEILM